MSAPLTVPLPFMSPLQVHFQTEMARLNQNYTCLWSKDDVDTWIANHA